MYRWSRAPSPPFSSSPRCWSWGGRSSPLLAPIYRWPGLKEPIGFYTDSPYKAVYILVSMFKYNILILLYWAYISMGLYLNIP
jgi:hypothetical protein